MNLGNDFALKSVISSIFFKKKKKVQKTSLNPILESSRYCLISFHYNRTLQKNECSPAPFFPFSLKSSLPVIASDLKCLSLPIPQFSAAFLYLTSRIPHPPIFVITPFQSLCWFLFITLTTILWSISGLSP